MRKNVKLFWLKKNKSMYKSVEVRDNIATFWETKAFCYFENLELSVIKQSCDAETNIKEYKS